MAPYDLFSPVFKRDPHPTFAAMRQEAPVYGHLAANGRRIWYITRYEDVAAVLRDNDHFSKNIRQAMAFAKPERPLPPHTLFNLINQNMLFADPPDHTRLRALVGQAFTPRRVEAMAGRIQAIADSLIDRVVAQSEMDLIEDYAFPLPMMVITALLGVPEADGPQVRAWTQAIIAPGSYGISLRQRKRKLRAFVDYLQALFRQRQQQPQDDLITALVQAEEAGDRLSEAELSSMVALLLVTGHETVVNLLGNGTLVLLTHPEQRLLLQEQPELMATAVEELLRYDGPVETSTTRWASKDFLLGGQQIRRGDIVRVVITSANRDPAHFPAPDSFSIDRSDNRHLAFGLGIHYCLGAPLARLEAQIALRTLLQRLPTLRLGLPTTELAWRSGVLFRGLNYLPVEWTNEIQSIEPSIPSASGFAF